MNRYKLVDKETKRQKGILKCDMEKLKKELGPRIIAGVCCTLIAGSTLGVFYEAVENVNDASMTAQVVSSVYENHNSKDVKDIKEDIVSRISYLDEIFNGFDQDDLINYPVITELSSSFYKISNPNILSLDEMLQYSDLAGIRDELRNICDSVKDVLERMNKKEDEDKKDKDKEDRPVFPYGDKKNDIFYKESLDTGRRL